MLAKDLKPWINALPDDAQVEHSVDDQNWIALGAGKIRAVEVVNLESVQTPGAPSKNVAPKG
jgi:hypothetical protein